MTLERRPSFEEYLAREGLGPETVRQHQSHVSCFLGWVALASLALEQVTHAEILDFAGVLRGEGRTVNHTNRILRSVRYYYAFLGKHHGKTNNPALGIRLKGSMRTVPRDLFTRKELDDLFAAYTVRDDRTHRNKVILGLIIYQALTRIELETLRPEHIRLREGRVQVPATAKASGRLLRLEPHQILDIAEYLEVIRPRLQQGSTRLFCGRENRESLKNTLLHLNHALRRINPKLKHAIQLRQSVVTEWLKVRDLRTVQYMAGHRYVSSTEHYKTQDLEELKEALARHHPLK